MENEVKTNKFEIAGCPCEEIEVDGVKGVTCQFATKEDEDRIEAEINRGFKLVRVPIIKK